MSSRSNVPDAVAVQLTIIIDPAGIVIVNVPLCPDTVPLTPIGPPVWPANCIVPENVLPSCVNVHVVLFIIVAVSPAPIIDPVESEAVPTQAPVIVTDALGLIDDDAAVLPVQAVAAKAAKRLSPIQARIGRLLRSLMERCATRPFGDASTDCRQTGNPETVKANRGPINQTTCVWLLWLLAAPVVRMDAMTPWIGWSGAICPASVRSSAAASTDAVLLPPLRWLGTGDSGAGDGCRSDSRTELANW